MIYPIIWKLPHQNRREGEKRRRRRSAVLEDESHRQSSIRITRQQKKKKKKAHKTTLTQRTEWACKSRYMSISSGEETSQGGDLRLVEKWLPPEGDPWKKKMNGIKEEVSVDVSLRSPILIPKCGGSSVIDVASEMIFRFEHMSFPQEYSR